MEKSEIISGNFWDLCLSKLNKLNHFSGSNSCKFLSYTIKKKNLCSWILKQSIYKEKFIFAWKIEIWIHCAIFMLFIFLKQTRRWILFFTFWYLPAFTSILSENKKRSWNQIWLKKKLTNALVFFNYITGKFV